MTQTPSGSKQAVPAFIDKLEVTSNKDQSKNVSLATGIVRVMYYESILQDTVKAEVTFIDTGNSKKHLTKYACAVIVYAYLHSRRANNATSKHTTTTRHRR